MTVLAKIVERDVVAQFSVAVPGPQGPAGSQSVSYEAGENVSAGRFVILEAGKVRYFQPSNPTHAGRGIGVTRTSALNGQQVQVLLFGIVTDSAFNLTADAPVFSRADGELFSTPASSGLVQQVGVAVAANSISVNIQPTISR